MLEPAPVVVEVEVVVAVPPELAAESGLSFEGPGSRRGVEPEWVVPVVVQPVLVAVPLLMATT